MGMANSESPTRPLDSEAEITLGVLNAIDENSALTQRSLARELGIALGLANAYLKRCAKKGLVKISQVPPNRYAYYLTPQGFAEKSRLTARYLSQSFLFFRAARAQFDGLFAQCGQRGWNDIALLGVSDLGEIAALCAREHPLRLVGFVDPVATDRDFAGLRVFPAIDTLPTRPAVGVVTDLSDPQATFDAAVGVLPLERVLAPKILKVARRMPVWIPEA